MTQTRRGSMVEAITNILIGFTINYIANLLILPLFGFHIGLVANFWMGCIYTAVSLLRQYAIRRWFATRISGFAARLGGA